MTNTNAVNIDDISERAQCFVDENFVFDAVLISRTGPDKMSIPATDTPFDESLIDEWRAIGVNVFLHPMGIFYPDSHIGQVRMLGMWNSYIADHTDKLVRIDQAGDFDEARDSGKIGIILGSHHGEPFRTVDDVDYFHHLGLRSCILVTFGQNRLGGAVDEVDSGGLSLYGRSIIERMNKLGMAVDLSHCSERSRLDAILCSEQPVIMSHANPAGACSNPRNTGDEVLQAMAERGGVIGVMPLRMMLTSSEPTTLDDYIDHLAYVRDLVGPDHLGVGSETPIEGFDSLGDALPDLPAYMRNEGEQRKLDLPELCHIRRLATIVDGMFKRDFSEEDIRKYLGGNFERVFREIFGKR